MRIVRFVETPEGGSRFEEIDIQFSEAFQDPFGNTLHRTKPFASNGMLVELPAGLDQDWHVVPNRQLVVVLSGRLEVETTDGQVRRWGVGEMFLADDPHGKGHRTRVLEGPAKLLFLQFDANFDPERWARP